jgi:phosphoglycolate phosphatase-like HAD superfamily hydrolase
MIKQHFFKEYNCIFWDFDGVIKDSVEVKSIAFEKLFESFGQNVARKVREHHEDNGGMSRYDKLPIYLRLAGKEPTDIIVEEFSEKFSKLVKQNVIDSEWVPGILDFFKNNNKQIFFLVTATPQLEIEEILLSLNIKHFFSEVIGAPTKKYDAIKNLLNKYSITCEESVMVGDSNSDYDAAKLNDVPFVLRRTNLNQKLQQHLSCPMIEDFL